MGCDIHGFWELYHPHFNRWVAFKGVRSERSYSWFGILSGVRGGGPKVASYEDEPDVNVNPHMSRQAIRESGRSIDDERFSRAWVEYCKNWGSDLHTHTVIPYEEVKAANLKKWQHDSHDQDDEVDKELIEHMSEDQVLMSYYEEVPDSDFIVDEIIFDTQTDEDGRQEPLRLPMNLPLSEILGTHDISSLVRMVVAYDN